MELSEIQELLNTLKTELLAEVDRRNQGLAASLSKEIKTVKEQIPQTNPDTDQTDKPESKNGRQTLADKALQTQLDELKGQLEQMQQAKTEAERKQFLSERDAFLTSHLSGLNLTSPSAVRKLLLADYGESIKKDEEGNWYLEKGESAIPLTQAIDSYLSSDEGKNFILSNPGAGTQPTKKATPPVGEADPFKAFAQHLTNN